MAPVVALTLNPAGNPVAPKLVGLFVAEIVTLYDAPTLPVASEVLFITGIPVEAGLITTLNGFVPVPVEFVADSVTLNVPEAVGVPLITPDEVFTLNPAGKPVAPKLVGLFEAVIVAL
jgi:hypothetical protein